MICMDEKLAFRQLSGEVPGPLITGLDDVAARLGIAKKRLLAAAVAAFVGSTEDEQFEMVRAAYQAYYATADRVTAEPTTDVAQQAADVLAEGGRQRRRGKPA